MYIIQYIVIAKNHDSKTVVVLISAVVVGKLLITFIPSHLQQGNPLYVSPQQQYTNVAYKRSRRRQ